MVFPNNRSRRARLLAYTALQTSPPVSTTPPPVSFFPAVDDSRDPDNPQAAVGRKVLIVTDAWQPQVNGVVRSYQNTIPWMQKEGDEVHLIGPDLNRWCTVSVPFYPEIKLEFFGRRRIRRELKQFDPNDVHIATEGPLGIAARSLCRRNHRHFTTAFHTMFPYYLENRVPARLAPTVNRAAFWWLRRFHAPASLVLVASPSIEEKLVSQKFQHLARWSRGVDMDLFKPRSEPFPKYEGLARPIVLTVGRVASEKNIPAMLNLETTGTKVVVGKGPSLAKLQAAYPPEKYPNIVFLGELVGEELAHAYADADVFVFASKTDTFGLVLPEACASGLRIASYPAPGPRDIFADPAAKSFVALNTNLQEALDSALTLPADKSVPRAYAKRFTWEGSTAQFRQHLQASPPPPKAKPRGKFRSRLPPRFRGSTHDVRL